MGTEEAIAESPNNRWPLNWSKDGRFLLYHGEDPKRSLDIWALPMTGSDRTPIVVAKDRSAEVTGQFSPDGRWVAYDTNESANFKSLSNPFRIPLGNRKSRPAVERLRDGAPTARSCTSSRRTGD